VGYIFEQEIEQILNTVRAKTIGEGENITLRDILGSSTHPGLKAYFRAEVEKFLEDERSREIRSKRFPYTHPEASSLQRQIDLVLVQQYQFPQEEFVRVLDEAVHFQFNYLCRPQWTLLNYIVGERRRVPVSEVERKLTRCIDYQYFPELIRRYCIDKGLAEVTYEEFKTLVERIDAEIVARHTPAELAAMTRSLLQFVDFGKASPHDANNQPTLPTNAVIVFFEDKRIDTVTRRLEFERDQKNRMMLTLPELASVLGEVLTDKLAPVVEAPEVPEPVESIPPQPVPGNGQMADQKKEGPADQGESAGQTNANFLPGVVDMFTPADVKRFTKSIFRKDSMAFRRALEQIELLTAWDATSHFLDDLFVAQSVDPFSREAVEFTDRIYARFFPSRDRTTP